MSKELSIFTDESGSDGGHSVFRLVTLVFHDQDKHILDTIDRYERDLDSKGLADIPFHAGPLMYGKDAYKNVDIAERRKMFASFSFFQIKLPFRYHAFTYKRSEVPTEGQFAARLRRDLVVFLADNLDWIQSFDTIKLYYDNGQTSITRALHAALEYEVSMQTLMYRTASPSEYRLGQVADYICTLELTALKFDENLLTSTDETFFGLSATTFKRNYLKKLRRKAI